MAENMDEKQWVDLLLEAKEHQALVDMRSDLEDTVRQLTHSQNTLTVSSLYSAAREWGVSQEVIERVVRLHNPSRELMYDNLTKQGIIPSEEQFAEVYAREIEQALRSAFPNYEFLLECGTWRNTYLIYNITQTEKKGLFKKYVCKEQNFWGQIRVDTEYDDDDDHPKGIRVSVSFDELEFFTGCSNRILELNKRYKKFIQNYTAEFDDEKWPKGVVELYGK